LLYKYLDPDRVDVLASNHIRFTQPADFNDPFEFRPVISSLASRSEMDELMDLEIGELIQTELNKIPVELRNVITPAQLEITTRQLYDQCWPMIKSKFKEMGGIASKVFIKKSNTLIGVLSLTEKSNNLLMWSHYARSHKGFCIGFDKSAPFFNRQRSEQDEFYHLRKVKYSSMRPTSRVSQLSSVELFFMKSLAWEYEQEWRMCAVLNDSEKTIEASPHSIHLFMFPRMAVKEVILGACMDDKVKSNLLKILSENYSHAVVRQAQVSSEQFDLEFLEL
jgi:hypothetical protein